MRTVSPTVLFVCLGFAVSCGPVDIGVDKSCGPSTCAGCCDANGGCRGGTDTAFCGKSGGLCTTCSTGQVCGTTTKACGTAAVKCPSISGGRFALLLHITKRGTGCSAAQDQTASIAFEDSKDLVVNGDVDNSGFWGQSNCSISAGFTAPPEVKWTFTSDSAGKRLTGTGYTSGLSNCDRIDYDLTATR